MLVSFLLVASSVSAQSTIANGATTLSSTVDTITTTLVRSLGTLFMSLAVVAFFWGVVQYIWGLREGTPEKIKNGNQFMVWGLIGLFVMFSVYGIIKFFQGTLLNGVDNSTITVPTVNIRTGQ